MKLEGNFINAPLQSCKPIDRPTKERILFKYDGKAVVRTIYERVRWKNMKPSVTIARFVIVGGEFITLDELECAIHVTTL